MSQLQLYSTMAMATGIILVVLFFYWRSGRINNALGFVFAAALIIGGAIWITRAEVRADRAAKAHLVDLFGLSDETRIIVFDRKSSKESRTSKLDAVFALSPAEYATVLSQRGASLEGDHVRFKYISGPFSDKIIDAFNVSPGALDWTPLPRPFLGGQDRFYPRREHYSLQHTQSGEIVNGHYICAVIVLPPKAEDAAAEPYDVISCETADETKRSGIVLLAYLNADDKALHVMSK